MVISGRSVENWLVIFIVKRIEVKSVCEVLVKYVVMLISVVMLRLRFKLSVCSICLISMLSVLLMVKSGVSVFFDVLLLSVIDYEINFNV